MIRKKKLLIISIILVITFLTSTNYLLSVLTATQNDKKNTHEKILMHLKELPSFYEFRRPLENDVYDIFISHVLQLSKEENIDTLWNVANSWILTNKFVDFESPLIGTLLSALKNYKIIKSDLDTRGTQLKLLLTLEGNQNVVFKPKWYNISTIIEGPVYAGKDRFNSEIISFYLSAMFNIPFTPLSVERTLSFSREIMPVATKRLINTSFEFNNKTCIYGKCFYCKKQDPICENSNFLIEGAVIFNVNASFKSYRSPWQRTYSKSKKATWEEVNNYCKYVKQKISKRRLLDLVDISIFDFLIQNGDRHHYETFNDNVVILDNGKGFGNPNIQHLDILAPLYQCCLLRNTTLKKLLNLAEGNLRKRLEAIPKIENLLTSSHITALEERLLIVFATIEYCKMEKTTP